ncbi:MAG: Na+/H+ antiporter subunit D [Planctomycetota bacterium]|jgi:multicomponent Na+:H+ antiporter subunit D
MKGLLILPVLIPAVSACLCLLTWRSTKAKRLIGVLGSALHLVSAISLLAWVARDGIQAMQAASWPAPFGITLVADLFGALMVLLGALVGFAIAVYSVADIDQTRQRLGYYPLLHALLMGVSGSFLTGDLFNLYVWFEVMLMASFVLTALGGERKQMEGALKYVTLNLISSAVFLAAVGILYATTRTLNLADLAGKMPQVAAQRPGLVQSIAALFLIGFGIKAAVFPFFNWLPASYPTPPAAVSALFAGLLTKVGVYALLRVFTLVFPATPVIYTVILVIAGLTMVVGVLGAYAQFEIRRILSFHIVSQIGYMILGLGLLSSPDAAVRTLGIAAAVFYIGHHIVVKTNLFLIGGAVRAMRDTYGLGRLGGLLTSAPWLAILFLVPALSLAGIPPLSGFWAKLAMIKATLQAEEYLLVAAALFAGLLTLMSMIKIWNEAFWKPEPQEGVRHRPKLAYLVAPSVLLALITLAIGFFPGPLFDLADRAADQMIDPKDYIDAVKLETLDGMIQGGGR